MSFFTLFFKFFFLNFEYCIIQDDFPYLLFDLYIFQCLTYFNSRSGGLYNDF